MALPHALGLLPVILEGTTFLAISAVRPCPGKGQTPLSDQELGASTAII
jgi:hypothetical protein